MNTQLLIVASIQFTGALVFAFILLRLAFAILAKKLPVASSATPLDFILPASASLFSVGYLFSMIIQPSLGTFRVLSKQFTETQALLVELSSYVAVFVVISLATAFIVISSGIWLNSLMIRRISKIEDSPSANLASGILTTSIILILTFVVKDSLSLMVESLIPYAKVPNVF